MLKFIVVFLATVTLAKASDITRFVKTKSLYIEGEKNVLSNREYHMPENEQPKHALNLGLDLDIGKNLYLDKKVSSLTNDRQFRFISLDFEAGVSKYGVDLYFRHFSGHTLDTGLKTRFPEDNAVGIRINLIGEGRR